jgi:hypothetical protein
MMPICAEGMSAMLTLDARTNSNIVMFWRDSLVELGAAERIPPSACGTV